MLSYTFSEGKLRIPGVLYSSRQTAFTTHLSFSTIPKYALVDSHSDRGLEWITLPLTDYEKVWLL